MDDSLREIEAKDKAYTRFSLLSEITILSALSTPLKPLRSPLFSWRCWISRKRLRVILPSAQPSAGGGFGGIG
jgi:hypothetical protein